MQVICLDHCGALDSPDDSNDYIYEDLAQGPDGTYTAVFPNEHDLRRHAQPSRHQGDRGTCAAFTAASIKEIQENQDCGFNEFMSPEFIYHHRDNKPSQGMYGRNVMQILQKIGSVPESLYPYEAEDGAALQPRAKLYEIAKHYRIVNFAKVTTIDGVKRALLELGPCYLQLPLFTNRPEFWRPAYEGEKNNGGHAVTIVGYTRVGFILKNSWGPNWNGDGCIIFPYDDWPRHKECWISIDEKTDTAAVLARKASHLTNGHCIVHPSHINMHEGTPPSAEAGVNTVLNVHTPVKKKERCAIM